MITANGAPGVADDALSAAIGSQTTDIIRIAGGVAHAAGGQDLSTLERASALLELAAVADRLDGLLDRLHGFTDALPEDAT